VKALPLARDARFEDEAARFALRFVCEDCGLFDAARGCAHGYPTARYERAAQGATLAFCKDFEPG
jgi:hypothetical protein